MASYTRLTLSAPITLLLAGLALALPACGNKDDGVVTLVDAASIDAPIDAGPAACSAPNMMCGSECLDTSADELHCGNCTTVCAANACLSGRCACPDTF